MSLPAPRSAPASSGLPQRAVLVGESDPPLIELLSDVLAEVDVTLHLDVTTGGCLAQNARPDMVLVVVHRHDFTELFARARDVAAGAPVIAILPFQDERLVRRSIAFGASACYSLDTPIQQLKSSFLARSDLS